jgi:ATP-dependent Clp protease ATP-binding subunit ClpC
MFERYNEKARQSIFFGRYEAATFSSPYIEPHHLLLGIVRADAELGKRIFGSHAGIEALRQRFQSVPGATRVSISVDLPVNPETRQMLAYASEEAESLGHKHIGPEHLLLGIARVETSVAAQVMRESGFTLAKLREMAVALPAPSAAVPDPSPTPSPSAEPTRPIEFGRDLTAAAVAGELRPLVGQERELDRLVQILSRRTRNNVALIGEPGVGKSAMVEGLAQWIATATESKLAHCKLLSLDASALVAPRRRFEADPDTYTIVCIEGLFDLAAKGSEWPLLETMHVLEPRLTRGQFQCIGTGTPAGLRHTLERAAPLARHFEIVDICEPDEPTAIRIVTAVMPQYAKFHGVAFAEGTAEAAVYASARFLPHRFLPDRAIDLIDEAAARVKVRRETEPAEITEARGRIRALTRKMENAIGKHDFDNARRHDEELRAERAKLERLRQERNPDDPTARNVTGDEIAAVISSRTGLPVEEVKSAWKQPTAGTWRSVLRSLAAAIPPEGNDWLPFLAVWLARNSPEEAEKLAQAIRQAKAEQK